MQHRKLLGISGSLRKDSFCGAVLKAIQVALPSEVRLTIHSVADVPLYNQDDDGEDPVLGAELALC